MNNNYYGYKGSFQVAKTILPIWGILISLIVLTSFLFSVTQSILVSSKNTEVLHYVVPGVLGPCLIAFIAIVVFAMYPSIHLSDNGIRTENWFITSDWIEWEVLEEIRCPLPSSSVLAIKVRAGLPKIYRLVGLTQGLGNSGFLVHKRIQNYEHLIQELQLKRPDLFDSK